MLCCELILCIIKNFVFRNVLTRISRDTIRKPDVTWNRKMIMALIKNLEPHPCLWNPSNRLYKNKEYRQNVLEHLRTILSVHSPKITTQQVLKKTIIIRQQYRREIRQQRESVRAGTGVYTPKLWFFDMCEFFADSIRFGSSVENSDAMNDMVRN